MELIGYVLNMDKIEKLNKLIELTKNQTLTRKDVEYFIAFLLNTIKEEKKNLQSSFTEESSEIKRKINEAMLIISEKHYDALSEVRSISKKHTDDFNKNIKEIYSLLKKVESIKSTPGKDGKDYVLTIDDKKEIASLVEVPIVEKVIEKVETPVYQTGEDIVKLVNELPVKPSTQIDAKHIKNLPKQDLSAIAGVRYLQYLADVKVTSPSNNDVLKYNSTTKLWENGVGGGAGISDGDKGDITVSGSGATWTIDNDVVTFAKMQNITTDRILGRDTSGSGDVEELTVSGGLEFTGTGIQRSALTGAITASAGSNTTSLGSFTLSQLNTALSDADVATGGGTATGTNTGDQTSIVGITGTKAQFDTAVTDGNFLYVGDITQYTDEMAQDTVAAMIQNGTGISWSYNDVSNTLTPTVSLSAFSTTNLSEGSNLYFTDERAQDAVGTILTDSSEIDFTYNDTTPSITASLIAGSVANSKLTNSSITIAGTSTALGGSITQDTITGLSSTGLIKRTGANTLAIASAGTDFVAPGAITSSGLTMATSRLLGRTTASTGAVEEITVASPLTLTGTTLDFDESVTLGNNARVAVNKNSGATVGTRRRINFIEGSNVTLTIADDSVNEEVDVTIAASGGGITDGDKGDITVSGSGATWTIDAGVVTLAKQADVATGTVFYRKTAGTGSPEVQTLATLKTDLGLTGTNSGDVSLSGENYLSLTGQAITANAVNLSGTNVTGTLAAARFPALTGDVTNTVGTLATTIANDAVTYAKMQNASEGNVVLARAAATSGDYSEVSVGASQLLGRGSTGDIAAITLGTNLSMSGTTLNASGGGGLSGLTAGRVTISTSATTVGDDAGFTYSTSNDYFQVGAGTPTVTLGSGYGAASVKAGGNTFYQAFFGQSTSSGTLASTDFILQNDAGTATTNYLDIGIASSNNNDGTYSISGAGSGYMYNQSGVLAIGTASNNELRFHTGGTTSSQRRMMIAGNASTVTIGLAGTSTGSLALTGSTSGTATITVAAAAGTPTLTLPTTTDTLVGRATTDTLTNKRITKRIQSTASAATVTPSWDNDDMVDITAQAAGLTLANPTGTPTNGQPLIIRIRDNGTTRTIAYGTQYSAVGVTLPTATTANKVIILGGQWNSNLSRIDVTAVAQEA